MHIRCNPGRPQSPKFIYLWPYTPILIHTEKDCLMRDTVLFYCAKLFFQPYERYREITKTFLQPFVTYIPSIPLIPKAVFLKMQPTVSKNSTFPLLPFKTVILRQYEMTPDL